MVSPYGGSYKKIKLEEYRTRVPGSRGDGLEGMPGRVREEYLAMHSAYANLLHEYFIRNFRLGEYDEALIESPYAFPEVREEDMDIYQYLASGKLRFVYIRNNIYIDRLSVEEQLFLREKARESELVYDQTAGDFIGETWKRVILEDPETSQPRNVFFGPMNGKFAAPENALVIGIRYDDYRQEPGQSDDKWMELNNGRLQDVETLSMIMEIRLSKATGVPTVPIKYNDFSITKRSKG